MKTLPIFALCCALPLASSGAQTDPTEYPVSLAFAWPPVVEQELPPVPVRPDPVREFIGALKDLAAVPDRARLRILYWPGAAEAAISESMAQLERFLTPSTGFALKDFAALPDGAKAFWQDRAKRLTSHEASGVLFVMSMNGDVYAMLPLQISEDGVRIVPPDHRDP